MKCNYCNWEVVKSLNCNNKLYYQCEKCNGIFLDTNYFISPEEQKKRYEKHNNSLEDAGYKKFLMGFIDPVLEYLINNKFIKNMLNILDLGSGLENA